MALKNRETSCDADGTKVKKLRSLKRKTLLTQALPQKEEKGNKEIYLSTSDDDVEDQPMDKTNEAASDSERDSLGRSSSSDLDEDNEDGVSSHDDEDDELVYSKTQKECNPHDNEPESSGEENDSLIKESENDNLEGEFEMVDPDEKFYHRIRHFIVEGALQRLGFKDASKNRPRHSKRPIKRAKASPNLVESEEDQQDGAVVVLPSSTNQVPPLASRLADCICNQVIIGTIISLPPDEDQTLKGKNEIPAAVVGFATLLNFRQYPQEGLQEIGRALVNSAKKRLPLRQAQAFEQLIFPDIDERLVSSNKKRLQEKRRYKVKGGDGKIEVGLFLNERMVNTPHQVVPDVLKCLRKDVRWSQTTEVNKKEEKERQFYFYTHVVGISKCFVLPQHANSHDAKPEAQGVKKPSKSSKAAASLPSPNLVDFLRYPKFEDEAFVKASELFYTIPTGLTIRIPTEGNSNKLIEAEEHKLVFLLTYKRFANAIKKLDTMLENQIAC